jgi:hypothetical protein
MNTQLRLVEPRNVNRQVDRGLRRVANTDMRSREYLLPAEIQKLIKAAKAGRWGHRDATLVLVWPTGMACGLWKPASLNGRRLSSGGRPPCMSGAPRAASQRFIQYVVTSCGC